MVYEGDIIDTIRTNPTKTANKKFLDFVNDDIEKYKCVVVCGHTHYKMIEDKYINSGSFGEYKDFVEINNGNVLVLSDIHIGDRTMKYNREEYLCPILEDPKYREIILIGDILDLWVTDPKTANSDYDWFFHFINKLSYNKTVVWILGNHDFEITKYKNIMRYLNNVIVTETYNYCYNGVQYLFIHGHQYDINSSVWYIKLFYKIWVPIGDNLWRIGKRLKKWALEINSKS